MTTPFHDRRFSELSPPGQQSLARAQRLSGAGYIVAVLNIATFWGAYGSGLGALLAALELVACCWHLRTVGSALRVTTPMGIKPCAACCCPDCAAPRILHVRNSLIAVGIVSLLSIVPQVTVSAVVQAFTSCTATCAMPSEVDASAGCTRCLGDLTPGTAGQAYGPENFCSRDLCMDVEYCGNGCFTGCGGCAACEQEFYSREESWPCDSYDDSRITEVTGRGCEERCECMGGTWSRNCPEEVLYVVGYLGAVFSAAQALLAFRMAATIAGVVCEAIEISVAGPKGAAKADAPQQIGAQMGLS